VEASPIRSAVTPALPGWRYPASSCRSYETARNRSDSAGVRLSCNIYLVISAMLYVEWGFWESQELGIMFGQAIGGF
jgi:hypothetical protein